MKISQYLLSVSIFLALAVAGFAQTGAQAGTQSQRMEQAVKDVFEKSRERNPMTGFTGNVWTMAAAVDRTDGGALVAFYITAANETGKFGEIEITVQPVVSDYDKDGVPRSTDVGQAARLRIPAMTINKGQAGEPAARPQITVVMPPSANGVKLSARKVANKELFSEMVLGINGDGWAGVSSTRY
jgi:hypothetical protein